MQKIVHPGETVTVGVTKFPAIPKKMAASLRNMFAASRKTESKQDPFVYKIKLDSRPTKRALLLIDPQNDFIADFGSLKVPGAVKDSEIVAQAIVDHSNTISQIFTTMDTHQRFHIAHPLFWQNAQQHGTHPAPFSIVTAQDMADGTWDVTIPEFRAWSVKYLQELEKQNRFQLTIWPEHCLVGSKGHAVFDTLYNALLHWEADNLNAVNYVFKGNNALTEHYSCFRAEVPQPDDVNTHINTRFIQELDVYDEILVAGQALSHCVNFSVRDLASQISTPSKIVVLVDGTSAIPGFESAAKEFRTDMEKLGVKFKTTKEAFA